MKYSEFYQRFGASLRTKNISRTGNALKSVRKVVKGDAANRRVWTLPTDSELPAEYVRLCPWEAEYLFNLARRAKVGILETGRFHGGSTLMLSAANPEIPIHSIDIEPQDDDRLRGYFETLGLGGNVDLIVGDSQRSKYDQIKGFDLLWIDGDHSYDGCTADLENWFGDLDAGGHIVLHDCYEGNEVKDSVLDFLARHPDVRTVTTPYRAGHYWHLLEGSLMHMIKA